MGVKSITKNELLNQLNKSKQKISELEKKAAKCKENELLLRELHHRVRNNMQIISSLLRIQARKIKDKKTIDMLKVCQDRIRSMALIHERFCRSDDLVKIELAPFIQDLAVHLFRSHGADSRAIKLITEMTDVQLDIDRAIPFALIANELLTNSLKHAFAKKKYGEIQIDLHPIAQEKFEFVVSDNGVGIPEETDLRNVDSFGLKMVNELVDQMNGNIELVREKGTTFKITC